MLEKISNLGLLLEKNEQISINGGRRACYKYFECIGRYINTCLPYIDPCP